MSFLPIVAREMRVSARKASTYWVRFAAAAAALAMGGYTFMVLQIAGVGNFAGQVLFGGLIGLIWIYAVLGGVFKTATTSFSGKSWLPRSTGSLASLPCSRFSRSPF